MLSIRDFSDEELLQQIENCKKELEEWENAVERHEGEISHLKAELHVALKEAYRRGIEVL